MAIVQQNFAAYLRTLRILFIALMMGQIIALSVLAFVRWQENNTATSSWSYNIPPFLPLIVILFVGASFFLYRRNLASARAQPDLPQKLTAYRLALLVLWAPLEITVLIMGVLYFITGQMTFIYMAVVVLTMFADKWPNRNRIVANLELDMNEQMILDDPNAIVSQISQRPG